MYYVHTCICNDTCLCKLYVIIFPYVLTNSISMMDVCRTQKKELIPRKFNISSSFKLWPLDLSSSGILRSADW